ncbi:4Fe-4S cluster-binding domain-containing protein [Stenotrophomonas sp. S48]|uniref:4Fe-4S cluster-binding domain-containing protein n=1 Tax=unclassified Stenotrophomonas TaxID=196198 RepID=UPI001E082794|nr:MULTISPECIES: 4Fe-4S cluster-binding domain-containing protein [unclassified Stenotrophomonas]MBK0026390.1 4Fe-4S cluster-binding domain-containing protein [Stenotrophomonas sp. S48]MBK0047459.1 4Fe-4S cluster-binding domain-containing protein [Stenotrophomonas sp. S49]
MQVSLSRVHFPITTLGPGHRLGIWFQGCSIRCPGCISADTWGPGHRRIEVDVLLEQLAPWWQQADGVTISGGEPFDQFDALLALLRGLRSRGPGDILVYSGHALEALQAPLHRASGLIDGLMSDPYLADAGQTRALRGSDNQRLSLLTDLGRDRLSELERPILPSDKVLDIMFDEDGSLWMAGIPRHNDLLRLRGMLRAQGHHLQTSAHAPSGEYVE